MSAQQTSLSELGLSMIRLRAAHKELTTRTHEQITTTVQQLMAPIFDQLAMQQRAWQALDMQVTTLKDTYGAEIDKAKIEGDHAFAHAEEAKRLASAAAALASQKAGGSGGGIGSIS